MTEGTAAIGPKNQSTEPNSPSVAVAALIVWAIICAALWAKDSNSIREQILLGPDDYMRAIQVSGWVDGRDWHDFTEPRMNPPDGVELHWTRLPDIPLASVLVATDPWLGRAGAITAAVAVVPALLLLLLLLASGWMGLPVLGRADAPNAILIAAMAFPLLAQFSFGRIDHHQWQLVITAVSLGALLRILLDPGSLRCAVLAAFAFAIGLWVGSEIIPWLAVFCAVLCFEWIRKGGAILRTALTFGAGLGALSALLLPITRPPGERFATVCDSHSIAYAGIALTVSLFWIGLWLIGRNRETVIARLISAGALATGLTIGLVALFPSCLVSPYSELDPTLTKLWIPNINEVRSVARMGAGVPYYLLAPALAIVIAAVRARNSRDQHRVVWLAISAYLAAGLVLSFWQARFITFTHVFSIVPIAWLASAFWRWVADRWQDWRRLTLILGSLLVLAALPSLASVALINGDEVKARENEQKCDIKAVGESLTAKPDLKLIAGFISDGAEILFRTRHTVLGAGYHRNPTGNNTTFRLLSSESNADALAIVVERGVDLIMICPTGPEMSYYRDRGYKTFTEKLIDGELPPWLTEVALPPDTGYLVFEVSGTANRRTGP